MCVCKWEYAKYKCACVSGDTAHVSVCVQVGIRHIEVGVCERGNGTCKCVCVNGDTPHMRMRVLVGIRHIQVCACQWGYTTYKRTRVRQEVRYTMKA